MYLICPRYRNEEVPFEKVTNFSYLLYNSNNGWFCNDGRQKQASVLLVVAGELFAIHRTHLIVDWEDMIRYVDRVFVSFRGVLSVLLHIITRDTRKHHADT